MKDELSALLDGDLDEESTQRVLDALRSDPVQQEKWATWCLIGDALRGEAGDTRDFTARVMDEIRSQPTLLTPAPAASASAQRRAANGQRSAMAIAASVMGVAAVGWVAYTLYPQTGESLSVASVPAAAIAADASLRPVRALVQAEREDPHLKYVFVHQAVNGGGPISGAVQHVRAVSDVRGEARR